MSGLNGTFALRGDNLVSYTIDLDKVLSTYASSQTFHLVDLAGYFFVGPLSTVALKGYRYGKLYYQTQGGKGTITRFVSHWKQEGRPTLRTVPLRRNITELPLRAR